MSKQLSLSEENTLNSLTRFALPVPSAYAQSMTAFVSRLPEAALFHIGLANPVSTVVLIILCLIMIH